MEIDMDSLGKRLRSIRTKKQMTLEELGEKIGFSQAFLGQIERGERVGSLESLVKIANALEVSIEDFLVDSLVTTNAEIKPKHVDDFSYVLLDCNESESRVIVRNAENLKELMKKYLKR